MIAGLTIPLSIFIALIILAALAVKLTVMSWGGLSIGVGKGASGTNEAAWEELRVRTRRLVPDVLRKKPSHPYPPELKSVNLDFDWTYRRLGSALLRSMASVGKTIALITSPSESLGDSQPLAARMNEPSSAILMLFFRLFVLIV